MRLGFFILLSLFWLNAKAQSNNCDKEILVFELDQMNFTDAAENVKLYQQYIDKNETKLTVDCSRRIYSLLANFLAAGSLYASADSAYRKALMFSDLCKSDTAKILALLDYARFLNNVAPDSALPHIKTIFSALKLVVEKNNYRYKEVLKKLPEGTAPSIFSIDELNKLSPTTITDMPENIRDLWRQYYNLKGASLLFTTNTASAENHLHSALFFDRNIPSIDYESVPLNNLGLLYQNKGNHSKAVEYFVAAMQKAKDAKEDFSVISTLSNLTYSYRVIKNFATAKQYSQEGITLARKMGLTKDLSRILSHYASIFIDEGDFVEAEKQLRESIAIAHSIDNKADLCYSMRKLGNMLINNTNRIEEGKIYADSSYYFARLIGDKSFYYYIDNALASYYLKIGQTDKALAYANESYKQSVAYADNAYVLDNMKLLYQIYDRQGNANKALSYYKQYEALKDSTVGKEVQFALTDIQEKYETQKKQSAIDKLEKEKIKKQQQTNILWGVLGAFFLLSGLFFFFNRKLNKQKKELQTTNALLAEATANQNRLFGIIGHDLKGMVAPFSRAGKIMTNYLQKNNLQDAAIFSGKLEENAGRLSETLNNLLHWSLQQMKGLKIEKETVNVQAAIKHVCGHYTHVIQLKNIVLQIDVKESETIFTDREALQVILRNLFSNALKFTENNSITFSSAQQSNGYQLIVTDKGTGMTEVQMQQLFNLQEKASGKGTQGESGSGLGMVVVQKIAMALGATVQISSKLQQGTAITLTFKNAAV
jgi:signal transduction histidine kinase/tetratricopeptide (TPR) repeat protein